MEYLRAEVL